MAPAVSLLFLLRRSGFQHPQTYSLAHPRNHQPPWPHACTGLLGSPASHQAPHGTTKFPAGDIGTESRRDPGQAQGQASIRQKSGSASIGCV